MASTAAEIQVMIDAIDTAITGILTTGQSFSINGRQYNSANLADLRTLRADFKRIVDKASSSVAKRTVAEF